MNQFDIAIIGAGITGAMIAWHLSRTNLKVVLIEKGADVANGATRANSGILHSGIHENPADDVFQMCRDGLKWYREWAEKLDFPLINKPTVILADSPGSQNKIEHLHQLHQSTLAPRLLNRNTISGRWPYLSENICGALEITDSAQISPYEACRAAVENAIANGLEFFSNFDIAKVTQIGHKWLLQDSQKELQATYVIIAAGSGSNTISSRFGLPVSTQKLISGAYFMLNKSVKPSTDVVFFGPPTNETKGVLVQNTVHGNLMLGPDSINSENLADDQFNWQRICNLWSEGIKMVPGLDRRDIIRTFTGERVNVGKTFQLENYLAESRIIRLDGIKSPGLTAAPAIAGRVLEMLAAKIDFSWKATTVDHRVSPATAAAGKPPGEIVCRCEQIFISQIREAIARGADNIESLRWQTRAGMGDCQGSFCRPALIRTLKAQLACQTDQICLKNNKSPMFVGDLK